MNKELSSYIIIFYWTYFAKIECEHWKCIQNTFITSNNIILSDSRISLYFKTDKNDT